MPAARLSIWLLLILGCLRLETVQAADQIEFLNGGTLKGKVIAIHKSARTVEFESVIAGQTQSRQYPYKRIHIVTWNEKEYVVTKRAPAERNVKASQTTKRSRQEVTDLIASEGKSAPDWIPSTVLEYPDTLDLNWPTPPPKGWNNKKNMGQYIWDRINPNASRWRGGIRLMVHLQSLHRNSPSLLRRVNESLAAMYFRFFQDYARAAYWWQKLGVSPESRDGISLAECYFRLGNKAMAMEAISGRTLSVAKIKLLGEMGEFDLALRSADQLAARTTQVHEVYLNAGDICRLAKRYDDAIEYYEKVISAPPARNEAYSKRFRGRAKESIETIKRFELLNVSTLKDGIYRGSSLGYEAPVHIEAKISGGRIQSVTVSKHREKQYYSALRDVPQQIISKQSVKNIDATSRATITAAAIINATAKALTNPPRAE